MSRIIVTVVEGTHYVTAHIRKGQLLITEARGRDAASAVATAVAQFRVARKA